MDDADWAWSTILALGLIGAIASIINWSWKPGQKAVARTSGRNALRSEGWAFVHRRGRYSSLIGIREAFGIFVDEVENIAELAAEVDESAPEGGLRQSTQPKALDSGVAKIDETRCAPADARANLEKAR
jgi:hypothetical protein